MKIIFIVVVLSGSEGGAGPAGRAGPRIAQPLGDEPVAGWRKASGAAIVPGYLADRDPRLVGGPIDELASDLWFLSHAELRHATRIRALSDYLAAETQALRPLFHGDRPAWRPSDEVDSSNTGYCPE